MSLPDLAKSLVTYSGDTPGARAGYADHYATARFIDLNHVGEGDPHPHIYGLPTPDHVAVHLLAKPIRRLAIAGGLDITNRDQVTDAARQGLSRVGKRTHGPEAKRTPREGREHLDTQVEYRDLSDWYRGLHAALRFTLADHPENANTTFDREAYVVAIVVATWSELSGERKKAEAAARAARNAKAAAERAARRAEQPTRAERARATHKGKADDRRDYIAATMADILADASPGATFTRSELVEMIRERAEEDYDYNGDPITRDLRDAPRRIAGHVLALATSLGLTERTLSRTADGIRIRPRGFVYTPQTIPEQPQETPVNIDAIHAETAAVRELAAAFREAREERDLFAEQTTALRSGDTLGALQLQAERMHPAPVTDLDAYRSRRAA